jgi:RHH-type rel operon transcriptional repressor/antitoxin RelB
MHEIATRAASAAASILQQNAATSEISRNAANAARGTSTVVAVLGKVSAAAAGTRAAAETVLSASDSVDTSVGSLRNEIEGFLKKVAVWGDRPDRALTIRRRHWAMDFSSCSLYMYSSKRPPEAYMLALRLPPDIEQRLDALAKKTGRSKSYYAREAILRQIEDIEDYYLARRRLARGGPRVTLESLERQVKRRAKR